MKTMMLFTNKACLGCHSQGHPERPQRVEATVAHLKALDRDWNWGSFEKAEESVLERTHPAAQLARLQEPRHFDADTAYHEGIYDIARLATGAVLAAMNAALQGEKAFSLMRPPGHHAEATTAMGFCYLNHVAIAAMEALARGIERVAVWDFDAHHGNGTEALLRGVDGTRYVSAHQHPCYPGTGVTSVDNCINFPVPPQTSAAKHMETLSDSWEAVLSFKPQLVLVSAGFDAYELDPLTDMRLRVEDFETLGTWLDQSKIPTAALLEGGYSEDLPELVEAFLRGWSPS